MPNNRDSLENTYVGALTCSYVKILQCAAGIATLPYLLTFGYCVNERHPTISQVALGIASCVFFSTAVPVLLAISAITYPIGVFSAKAAFASMLLTYPMAIFKDFNELTVSSRRHTYN